LNEVKEESLETLGMIGLGGPMTIENHIDWDHVEEQGFLDEDTFWEAVSDMTGRDVSEVADGDPMEWL
tara:strand:- start:311 stop:514 length:204 start_codon:yes stop_codon:yes gene_type:complete